MLKKTKLSFLFFLFFFGAYHAVALPLMPETDEDVPFKAYFHYLVASDAFLQGDWDKALRNLEKVIELDPGASHAYSLQAEIKYAEGNATSAEELARRAIKINDENVQAHRLLGEIYQRFYTENDLMPRFLDKSIAEYQRIIEINPKDQEAHFALGRLFYIAGDFDSALESLKKHLQIDPTSTPTLLYIAKIYSEWGDADLAREYLERALEINPGNPALVTSLADIYMEAQQYARAAEYYQQAAESGSQSFKVLYNLAECYKQLEKPDKAISVYEILTDADPENITFLNELSILYEETQEYQKGIETFDKLIEQVSVLQDQIEKTTVGYLLIRRGEIYFRIGDYQHAVKDYTKARSYFNEMQDEETYGFLLRRIAHAELELKHSRKTLSLVDHLMKTSPEDQSLKILRARALAAGGSREEAIRLLRNMLEAENKNLALYLALSELYEEENRLEEIVALLQSKENLFGRDDMYYYFLGIIYERAGKTDAAEAVFKKALEINPNNDRVLNSLSYLYADRGMNLEASLDMIQRAREIDTFNGAYLDTLGWVYYKLNRLEEAEETLLIAARKMRDPVIYDHLGDVYRKTNNFEKAIKYWKIALSLNVKNEEEVKNKIELTREKIASKD